MAATQVPAPTLTLPFSHVGDDGIAVYGDASGPDTTYMDAQDVMRILETTRLPDTVEIVYATVQYADDGKHEIRAVLDYDEFVTALMLHRGEAGVRARALVFAAAFGPNRHRIRDAVRRSQSDERVDARTHAPTPTEWT